MTASCLPKNEVITDIKIGEHIPCDYSYESGFSNLGTGNELSFICVERNSTGAILVSDTVFSNLSFNEINTKGFIYGNELTNHPYNGVNLTVKSLTGKVYSNSDIASQYDKYIVNSNLNGLISPGDKNVWNWDIGTITSSLSSDDTSKAISRGGSSLDLSTYVDAVSSRSNLYGFRPVLEVEFLYIPPIFNVNKITRVYSGEISLTDVKLDHSIKLDEAKVKVDIHNISTGRRVVSTDFIDVVNKTVSVNCNFNILDFRLNSTNVLKIIVSDKDEVSSCKYIKIFPISDDVFVVTSNVSETNPIINHKNKENLLISIESNGGFIIAHNSNDSIKIIEHEEYAKASNENKFIIFHDEDITAYGVCFC